VATLIEHKIATYNLREIALGHGKVAEMDRITAGLLAEFSTEFGISELPEDSRFEHLAAWLTVRRHYSESTFDPSDLVTGNGGDTGIDAIAIIANNNLITDDATIDDLIQINGYLDVTFVFVQAERSAHFDMAKIGQFGFGVSDFFGQEKLQRNEVVSLYSDIMKALYNQSSKFRPKNPSCILYYVTTGKWNNEPPLVTRAEAEVSSLKETGLFSDVSFVPIGAAQILSLYRQSQNAIQREFIFDQRVVIPEVSGVTQAYLGFLKALDFLNLVCDEDGTIIKSLFYENVRDWIGYNQINQEMRATLEASGKDRFVLMNNGVTVISRMLHPTGNKFLIGDFQVVNGCQTTHVLHDNKALLDDSVRIPFRLITTQDEAVIEAIIKATNRQTEVRDDQFFAMKDFAKKLETYFKSFTGVQRLYYERRPHQYDDQSIEKYRIITHQNLIRAVGAMFLGEPHITTKTFRQLTAKVGKEIFLDSDRCEPYYVAAYALSRIEQSFKLKVMDTNWKPARYQLLLAVRLTMDNQPFPRMNSNEMTRRCNDMVDIISDWEKFGPIVQTAQEAVLAVARNEIPGGWNRDSIRTEPITRAIFKHFNVPYRGANV
jgi:hypothetical protein